jgi:hypothetical protein
MFSSIRFTKHSLAGRHGPASGLILEEDNPPQLGPILRRIMTLAAELIRTSNTSIGLSAFQLDRAA